jgi:hypothetical protein
MGACGESQNGVEMGMRWCGSGLGATGRVIRVTIHLAGVIRGPQVGVANSRQWQIQVGVDPI